MRSENESSGQASFIEEARRSQIISAAVDVIAEVGYGNASLAKIARSAGISKGVISYHFDGKDDLMYQVVMGLYTRGAEFIAPRMQAGEGARAKIMAYIDANLQFIAENEKHVNAMTEVVLNFREPDGALKFGSVDGEEDIMRPLLEFLAEGQKTGEFNMEFDPRSMAMFIRDAIDGTANRFIKSKDFDIAKHTRQLCATIDRATKKGQG